MVIVAAGSSEASALTAAGGAIVHDWLYWWVAGSGRAVMVLCGERGTAALPLGRCDGKPRAAGEDGKLFADVSVLCLGGTVQTDCPVAHVQQNRLVQRDQRLH
jgi:hypothetical protein